MSTTPFDVTMKDLIEENARAWAERFSPGPVVEASMIDADVSTVTAHADKVIRVSDAGGECLLNIEAESSHAGDIPDRMLHYAVLLRHQHGLPVRSVVILLRPAANALAVTGTLEVRRRPDEPPYLTFTYEVVRLWTEPLAPLLDGPVGLLPLAPLTDEARADLPGVVGRVVARLRAETSREQAGKMEMAAFVLMGLRYEDAVIESLFREIPEMEESTTYQLILRRGEQRGEARGMRETILEVGRRRFGEPSGDQAAALEQIADPNRLRGLASRIIDSTSWQELLA